MTTKSTEELENIVSLSKSPAKRVQALLELSSRHSMSDLLRSWMLAREAERDAEILGEETWLAKANVQAGNALWKLADYLNAQKHFIKAAGYYENIGDHDGMANSFCGLGIVYGSLKDHTQALYYFELGVEHSNLAGNRKRAATNMGNIATVWLQLEKYDEALDNFQRSLDVYEELKDDYGIANMLNGIAGVKVHQKKFEEAEEFLNRHSKISHAIQNHYGIATGLMNFGILYSKMGDYRLAIEYLEKAMLQVDSAKIRAMKHGLHKTFAEVYTDMGKSDKALEHYKIYFDIEKEMNAKEIRQKAQVFEQRKDAGKGQEKKVA